MHSDSPQLQIDVEIDSKTSQQPLLPLSSPRRFVGSRSTLRRYCSHDRRLPPASKRSISSSKTLRARHDGRHRDIAMQIAHKRSQPLGASGTAHTRKDTPRPSLVCGVLTESPILPDDGWLDTHSHTVYTYDSTATENARAKVPSDGMPDSEVRPDHAQFLASACNSAVDPSSSGSSVSQVGQPLEAQSTYLAHEVVERNQVIAQSNGSSMLRVRPTLSMCESASDSSTSSSMESHRDLGDLRAISTRDTIDPNRGVHHPEEEWAEFCANPRASSEINFDYPPPWNSSVAAPEGTTKRDGPIFGSSSSNIEDPPIFSALEAPLHRGHTLDAAPMQSAQYPLSKCEQVDETDTNECAIIFRDDECSSAESDVPLVPRREHQQKRTRRRKLSDVNECAGVVLWILCLWKRCMRSMLLEFYSRLWENSPNSATRDSFFWP